MNAMRLLALATLLASVAAFAGDDLTPDQRAKILNDQKKAGATVDKKYGNRKPSEMTPDERRSYAKEKADAEREAVEKAGQDPKEFARSTMKMGRDEKADTDQALKNLEAKDKAAGDAPAGGKDAKKGGKKEIIIEKNGKVDGADPAVNEAAEMDKAQGLGKGKK